MKKIAILSAFLIFSIYSFAQPAIGSFAPLQGDAGTAVTITGTGFNTIASNNIVYFGAVKATVGSASANSLTVVAPVGATYQPISVTVNNLTAYSTASFIETFAGDNGPFTANSFLVKNDIPVGMYPHCVSLADFNGDGKSDVLVSRGSSNVLSVFTNLSVGGNISFSAQTDLPATGNNHEAAATGDLDGDGKIDFVVTNSNNLNSVSVFRNTSSGSTISFATKIDYAADNGPYTVAIGDLDGDGKPDLAIANNGSNIINLYKNISTPGNISFTSKTDLVAGTNPYSIAVADLNGDGKPEIIFTTQGSGSALSVMRNNSTTGSFSFDAPLYCATISGSFIVAAGDLDGDGKPDLAAASASGSVIIVRNISAGSSLSFSAPQNFTTGNYPECVSICDLNGDGKPDLVTANWLANSVSVLKNKSTSGNISFDGKIDYAVGENPSYLATGDLDGDGRPDIVAANTSGTAISVLRNISGANISPVITSVSPDTAINGTIVKITGTGFTGASSVKFGGTDAASFTVDSATGITAIVGSGANGIVTVTTPFGTASWGGFVYRSPIISLFSPAIAVSGTSINITGYNFTGATAVKFGGTDAASFVVNSATSITAITAAGSSGSVSVTTGYGTGLLAGFSFGAPTITSFSPVATPVGSVITINGTGFDPTPANNIVFLGAVKATVSLATASQLTIVVPAGATYQPLSVTTNHLTAFSSQSFVTTFPADSVGITASSFSTASNYGTGIYPSAVSLSDVDGDGKADLIVTNNIGNSISILKNTSTAGNISISTKTDFSTGIGPKQIATGDLDGDGKKDIVISNFNSGGASTISVFRNTSTSSAISMAAKTDYSSGNGTLGIVIADMDADGKPDVLAASGNSGFISFFKNISITPGIILLAAKIDIPILSHADNIITADLDNDGKPDLISSNFGAGSISIFRNTSSGGVFSVSSNGDYTAGTNPSYISAGDINGDGKIDIILSNYSSGNISFYQNLSSAGFISLAAKQDYTLAVSTIALADLNGDGRIDLLGGTNISGKIAVLANTSTGSSPFSFLPKVDFTTGNYDTFTATGDLDGDGKPELIAANTTLNTVSILRNKISDPIIDSLSADTASAGSTITLEGRGFTGTTDVRFGGTAAASFNVVSATKIDAVVGGGASGDITISAARGVASISGFKFIPAVSAGGATSFCKGATVMLTSSADANNQWYKDGVAISSATGNTYSANASGIYTVKTISNGITTTSATGVTVNVTTVPPPLITTAADRSLVSSIANGNQWYLNGTLIAGANKQTYLPTQDGSYTVKDTANGCVSDFSATHQFLLTAIIELGNNQYIKLYPNPIKGKLNINWNVNGVFQLNIAVTDINGKAIIPGRNIQNNTALDLSALPQGFYFIKIYSNNQFKINQTVKIIKGK